MDTGKKQDTSTGDMSTKTPPLANESAQVAKPSNPVRTKSVSKSSLKELADRLSLLQEDLSQYQKLMEKIAPNKNTVMLKFQRGYGAIILFPPDGNTITYTDGHIHLNGKPVTGWEP